MPPGTRLSSGNESSSVACVDVASSSDREHASRASSMSAVAVHAGSRGSAPPVRPLVASPSLERARRAHVQRRVGRGLDGVAQHWPRPSYDGIAPFERCSGPSRGEYGSRFEPPRAASRFRRPAAARARRATACRRPRARRRSAGEDRCRNAAACAASVLRRARPVRTARRRRVSSSSRRCACWRRRAPGCARARLRERKPSAVASSCRRLRTA